MVFLAGTFLGLSLVRAIVHSHGGSVNAISHLGKGSTFTVTLTQPSL
ncbi:MAG: HAMP domain-containing histidine kinase [Deltaproteobacteria bacterium]|nr:HAMP domain-containing histidine kinase [Deltaproteobacteria bacterium]